MTARIGPGVARRLPEVLATHAPSAVAVVADARVASLHPSPVKGVPILVPPGEENKTLESWRRLLDAFVDRRLDREAVVVAFGGGVTLDLAGFAAAAYLRGVRWVAVPTTLLAQVDAAHGGKTGVDHPAAKNLVGAFHAPVETLVDPAYLRTLPDREVRCGLAEVVKHAVIAAPALLARVGREDPSLFVSEAAAVKIAIVERDPLERGERRVLNLGHTLGHAFERAAGYAISHGEAVGVGLRAACAIAERHCRFPSRAEVEAALDRCGLPRKLSVDPAAVLEALGHDKKRSRGRLRWILPVALGDVRAFDDVPEDLVGEVLRGRTGS